MIITKMAIPRRTVLRGMGAALALPLLDAMVPALTALENTPANPIRRLGVVYVPNGMVGDKWLPTGEGASFEFSPILSPLAPFRDKVLILTNLAARQADAQGDGNGDHGRAGGSYLTGVHVRKSESVVQSGISMDQIAAKAFEKETQLSSLQLSVDANNMVGSCDGGYSCAYTNTISWLTPTLPLMAENDPRVTFERMFGSSDSTDKTVRSLRLHKDQSILDSVTSRASDLQRQLGSSDRAKVSNYLESLRDVERRIQKAEEQADREIPPVDRPSGVPDTFEEHVKILYDLQVLAYQCDLTRVITFMYGREITPRTYPNLNISEPHHGISHHANDPEKLAKLQLIQTYHISLFSQYLEKLRATPDGDGSLLDHISILYGGGISNSDRHSHDKLPTLVVGGGGGTLKGGQHLVYPEDTPLANLHVTLLQNMGLKVEQFGDSNGIIKELSGLSV